MPLSQAILVNIKINANNSIYFQYLFWSYLENDKGERGPVLSVKYFNVNFKHVVGWSVCV